MGGKKCMDNKQYYHCHHQGLFTHVDIRYDGFFHDVSILKRLEVYKNWCDYVVHGDTYFEYLLGDLGYMGGWMFIMKRFC
jgi:hypothetical protein